MLAYLGPGAARRSSHRRSAGSRACPRPPTRLPECRTYYCYFSCLCCPRRRGGGGGGAGKKEGAREAACNERVVGCFVTQRTTGLLFLCVCGGGPGEKISPHIARYRHHPPSTSKPRGASLDGRPKLVWKGRKVGRRDEAFAHSFSRVACHEKKWEEVELKRKCCDVILIRRHCCLSFLFVLSLVSFRLPYPRTGSRVFSLFLFFSGASCVSVKAVGGFGLCCLFTFIGYYGVFDGWLLSSLYLPLVHAKYIVVCFLLIISLSTPSLSSPTSPIPLLHSQKQTPKRLTQRPFLFLFITSILKPSYAITSTLIPPSLSKQQSHARAPAAAPAGAPFEARLGCQPTGRKTRKKRRRRRKM